MAGSVVNFNRNFETSRCVVSKFKTKRHRVYYNLASPAFFLSPRRVVEISYYSLSLSWSLQFDNESFVVSNQLHLIDTDM